MPAAPPADNVVARPMASTRPKPIERPRELVPALQVSDKTGHRTPPATTADERQRLGRLDRSISDRRVTAHCQHAASNPVTRTETRCHRAACQTIQTRITVARKKPGTTGNQVAASLIQSPARSRHGLLGQPTAPWRRPSRDDHAFDSGQDATHRAQASASPAAQDHQRRQARATRPISTTNGAIARSTIQDRPQPLRRTRPPVRSNVCRPH